MVLSLTKQVTYFTYALDDDAKEGVHRNIHVQNITSYQPSSLRDTTLTDRLCLSR